MPLTPHQQATEQIGHAKRVLLLTHHHPSVDDLATMTALGLLLKKLNKPFDAVIPQFKSEDRPGFLSSEMAIQPRLGATRAFHIQLNTNETPLSELQYDLKNGILDITLIPKQGSWTPQDVSFKHGQDRYDLVIVIGCADRQTIGALSQEQTDFLFRNTVINLDHQISNELWGQINLVQPTAVSSSEALYRWMMEWNQQLIDQPIATALLAGMIATTRSFKTTSVTPHTLETAAKLVELGADRGRIVQELWRTKPVESLKLWGKLLSRLTQETEQKLMWTMLTQDDLIECHAEQADLESLVSELLRFSADANVIVILQKTGTKTIVTLFTQGHIPADDLARLFGAQGTKDRADFAWPHEQTPTEIIQEIKGKMKAKFGN